MRINVNVEDSKRKLFDLTFLDLPVYFEIENGFIEFHNFSMQNYF